MKVEIDGNMWCCSNGLCLSDPTAQFTFGRTLRETLESYQKEFNSASPFVPESLAFALDLTPEDYTTALAVREVESE